MLSVKFRSLLIELKLNPEDFGNKIGAGKSSVYKLLRGDTKKVTRSMAKRISFVFPQFSSEYLVGLNIDTIMGISSTPEIFLEKEDIRFTENEVMEWLYKNREHFKKHNRYFGLVKRVQINAGIEKTHEEKGFKKDYIKHN